MYCADSNILSIVLAFIALAAGVYSASGKGKKRAVDFVQLESGEEADLSGQENSRADAPTDALTDAPTDARAELFEEAVPTTGLEVQEPVAQEKSNDLKSRLKNSPKDAVLFAEILKPKYKEF